MKIHYQNKRINKLLTEPKFAIKTLGKPLATKLYQRKAEIEAADWLSILIEGRIGRCHPLHYDLEGLFGLSLDGPTRLIIKPVLDHEGMDYEEIVKCKNVKIIGVLDYHGQKNEWIFR